MDGDGQAEPDRDDDDGAIDAMKERGLRSP
jgi:hypothetical protein